jgi:hypothetical protein
VAHLVAPWSITVVKSYRPISRLSSDQNFNVSKAVCGSFVRTCHLIIIIVLRIEKALYLQSDGERPELPQSRNVVMIPRPRAALAGPGRAGLGRARAADSSDISQLHTHTHTHTVPHEPSACPTARSGGISGHDDVVQFTFIYLYSLQLPRDFCDVITVKLNTPCLTLFLILQ